MPPVFSDQCSTYLRTQASVLSAWDRATLEQWLDTRRAPFLDVHARWEEALALVLNSAPAASAPGTDHGGGLVEIENIRFGAVGLAKPWPEWTVEHHDGDPHVLVGMSMAGYARRFYLREDGALFLRQGRLWLAVSTSPFIYLERMAARNLTARIALTIEVGQRAGSQIAGALGITTSTWASDAGQPCWADDQACVIEGAWDRPAEQVTTVYLGALGVARELLTAAAELGLALRVESSAPSNVLDAPSLPRDDLPAGTPQAAYASPSDCCGGLVAYEGSPVGERLVQVVWEEERVIERALLTGAAVELRCSMQASRVLADRLSPRTLAYLDEVRFLRDPRRTCRITTLSDLLAQHRLAPSAHVFRFESELGGVLQDYRAGGFRFGVFDMLSVQRATGLYGGRYETEHEPVLLFGEDWPRVRWRDKWLVPVGDLVSTHIYMAEDGMLYEHAWEIDELYASAERGGVLVERLAAAANHRKISLYEASIHADVGTAIAVAESTPRIEPASDRVSSYWQDPKLSVRADHGEPPSIPKTLLGACSEALFMRVMRRARALAPQAEIHAEGNSLDALESAGFQVSWS